MKKALLYMFFSTLIVSCSHDNKTLIVKKSEYTGEWPFSVDEIEIYCSGYKEIYGKVNNGKIYPLNGSAKGTSQNNPEFSDIKEIWLDDPNFPGVKIPYTSIIQQGLMLCEDK